MATAATFVTATARADAEARLGAATPRGGAAADAADDDAAPARRAAAGTARQRGRSPVARRLIARSTARDPADCYCSFAHSFTRDIYEDRFESPIVCPPPTAARAGRAVVRAASSSVVGARDRAAFALAAALRYRVPEGAAEYPGLVSFVSEVN